MIKIFFTFIFTIAVFTGCANNTLKKEEIKEIKNEKQVLIDKANNGDIKAMLELNKTYLFPQTKEGLELYNKWFGLVLKSKNIDDMMSFYHTFKKYQKMFINAEDKSLEILEAALDKGSQKALYLLVSIHLKNKKDIKKLEQKIINKANQNQLISLHNAYIFSRQETKANKIKKLITKTDKQYFDSLIISDKIYYFKLLYLNSRAKRNEYHRILKDTINSNDPIVISTMANLLFENSRWYEAQDYLKKAVKLNDKDIKSLLNLAKNYEIIDERKNKDKIISNLKKASLLDSYEASKKLLEIYKKDKNTKEYIKLKKELLNLYESKRALADFYYEKTRYFEANNLYEELAQKAHDKTIIKLASQIKTTKYEIDFFNPELDILIDKYRAFILNSKKPYLRAMLKKEILNFREFEELRQKIIQIEIKENNLQTLKDLDKHKYSNEKKPNLKKAADFGDIEAKYLLADGYSRYGDDAKKAIAIYEELLKKGDKKAYAKLAKAYEYAPFDRQKDNKKSLYYYERAYKNGDKDTLQDIIYYYICPRCATYDKNKADIYIKKAIEDKNAKIFYNLGKSFHIGKSLKKDFKRAEGYYKKAFELGESKAYFNLADLYRTEYKDDKKAFEVISKCAKKYNYECITQLGFFYHKGIGVKKDIDIAIQKYQYTANYNKTAAYNLAVIYFNKKDYTNAINYFRSSAKEGHKKAAGMIGMMYKKGLGVKKNLDTANIWYKKAK